MGTGFIEFMDFDIHKHYEWNWNLKNIKIECDIRAYTSSELAKTNKNENEKIELNN
jgi:hypothetical protein